MRRVNVYIVAIALGISTVATAAPDLSSPKSAVISFATAIAEGNATDAKASTLPNETSDAIVDVMATMAPALDKLSAAAQKKFGDEGKQITAGTSDVKAEVEKFKEAKETIEGETATVTAKDRPNDPIPLRKIDGAWKVDAAAMFGADGAEVLPMFKEMSRIFNEVAIEIDEGKHETVDSAQGAMRKKFEGAVKALVDHEGHDHGPTTGTTTKPVQ